MAFKVTGSLGEKEGGFEAFGHPGNWTMQESQLGTIRFYSLIDLYASRFAGFMTIRDMGRAFIRDGIFLDDFAAENHDATMYYVKSRIRLAKENCEQKNPPLNRNARGDYPTECLKALKILWEGMRTNKYPLIKEELESGISYFESLIGHSAQEAQV